MRVGSLLEFATAVHDARRRGPHLRKLEGGKKSGGVLVGVGVDRSLRIALVVVLQLPERSDGVDADATTYHRLIVAKGTIGKADARIEVALVSLAQSLG